MTTKARIQKIEARLDALENKPTDVPAKTWQSGGVGPEEPTLTRSQRRMLDEILQSLRDGEKINAIKNYRGLTGLGLRESKDAVVGVGR